MKKCNVAIVGATGVVGRTFLKVLEERDFPIDNLYLFASSKSKGIKLPFKNAEYTVEELTEENLNGKNIDVALFSAGAKVSEVFAPLFAERKILVIDNSKQWRTDENVPLVVPECNGEDIFKHNYIIANPNCSTIQAVVPLKVLDDKYKIKRIIYTTFQAVSGAGSQGIKDLDNGIKGESSKKIPRDIFANVVPQIDDFLENGYTKEEEKMIFETKKILHNYNLLITATTVRVPVYYGHSESINVEFFNKPNAEEAANLLNDALGLTVTDIADKKAYPTPKDCENKDGILIGRVRQDTSCENALNIWVVADNIRKGAATNAVQIAERYIKGE